MQLIVITKTIAAIPMYYIQCAKHCSGNFILTITPLIGYIVMPSMEKRQLKYRELSDLGQVTQPARSRALEQILQADFNFCPGG